MKVDDGLVGIADTRLTSGNECYTAKKISVFHQQEAAFFMMSSGLRSVRDKALAYFKNVIEAQEEPCEKMFELVNLFAEQLRKVAKEDKEALSESGLNFNLHCLMGGQMPKDDEHKLFMVYPQANWVEIGEGTGTPYQTIGVSGYGKSILDRTLKRGDSLEFAMKVGCLSFDSTRINSSDVDYPLDVLMYKRGSFNIVEHRYEEADLTEITQYWDERLRQSVEDMPESWIEHVFIKSKDNPSVSYLRSC
jgi:putative proteasome-type protease